MSFDTTLLNELDTDTAEIGYAAAGWTANPPNALQYQAIADLINAPTRPLDRTEVPGHEIFAAIQPTDFLTVFNDGTGNKAHMDYMRTLFTLSSVPLDNTGIRTALTTVFNGMTTTLGNIIALQTTLASRAREIGIGPAKVGDLRRLKGDVT